MEHVTKERIIEVYRDWNHNLIDTKADAVRILVENLEIQRSDEDVSHDSESQPHPYPDGYDEDEDYIEFE